MLSVIIITLNEEENLASCLEALPKKTEVIIVDSGSTDKTVEIAKSYDAKVYTHPFKDYSQQKKPRH